ncbi:MAG TPA: hypothetical protein VFK05_17465 [Polyangiaceae bacterium]|nr:hypothetical protein [Polyangiaceae bacterium]
MAGSVAFGVALATTIAVLGCGRSSDERAGLTGGTSSAAGASAFGGALASAGAADPAARAGAGAGGGASAGGGAGAGGVVVGAGGSDAIGGAGGALAGGGGNSSLGAAGGASPQGGASQSSGVSVSLDLMPSLQLANDTLFFPLTGTLLPPVMRGPSEPSGPNELLVLYTRATCAGARPEMMTANPSGLADGVPTLLATVSITHDLRGLANAKAIVAESTCLTLGKPDGHWLPVLSPTNVLTTDTFVTFEFDVPAEPVDAVGIFLPTYTAISNITYTIRSP